MRGALVQAATPSIEHHPCVSSQVVDDVLVVAVSLAGEVWGGIIATGDRKPFWADYPTKERRRERAALEQNPYLRTVRESAKPMCAYEVAAIVGRSPQAAGARLAALERRGHVKRASYNRLGRTLWTTA